MATGVFDLRLFVRTFGSSEGLHLENSHLTKLAEAGLVELEKRFIHKKPNTKVTLTAVGKARIAHHWDQLERLKNFAQTPGQR